MHPATIKEQYSQPLKAILSPFTGGEALEMGGEAKGKHVFPGELQRETLQENKKLQLPNLDLFSMGSCQELSSCTFSTAKARWLARVPEKQAEEGF